MTAPVRTARRRPAMVALVVYTLQACLPGKRWIGALVPAAEVGHPASGAVTLAVNGEERQAGDLNQMIWKVPEMIAYLSEYFELAGGDVILSGTPAGVGYARKPPVWMKPGDTIEIEIEGIGTLSNPIRDED